MEAIGESIKAALPLTDEDTLTKIKDLLTQIGVTCLADLILVKEGDLTPVLKIIQARKLISFWQTTEAPVPLAAIQSAVPHAVQPTTPPASTSSDRQPREVVTHLREWDYIFEMPWNRLPSALSRVIKERKRPSPQQRREFVRIVVERIVSSGFPNPTRPQISEVSSSIVRMYPESFCDMGDAGVPRGSGYYSLVHQLKSRVELLNRGNSTNRRRAPRRCLQPQGEEAEVEEIAPQRRQVSHACLNWQPHIGDEGQLHALQVQLQASYAEMGPLGCMDAGIMKAMSDTYPLQRRDINGTPSLSIAQLKAGWPFLFGNLLFDHFQSLVGFNAQDRFASTLADKGAKILSMFRSKGVGAGQRIYSLLGEPEDALTFLRIIQAFFNEDEDSIFFLAEITDTHQEVVQRSALPGTPRLIIQGSSFSTIEGWMLSTESELVMKCTSSPTKAVAALFACYYVFNLEYQAEAASTLEFIQRFFFGIVAEGSRSGKGPCRKNGKTVFRKSAVSPRVHTLIKMVTDFEWGL